MGSEAPGIGFAIDSNTVRQVAACPLRLKSDPASGDIGEGATTRFWVADYALRDSITAAGCDRRWSPTEGATMTRSRPITFLASAAALPLIALAVAACGGGGAATAASAPKTSSGASATVGVANSSLGSILVNSDGHTLYLFKADSGTNSACAGACATAWPPVLATSNPTAGTGLTASKLGTITRSDGNRQVTYNGHPLYRFVKDTKAGQTNGQGVTAFGASWFALAPSGNQASAPASSSGGGASSGGSLGY
jgi:predicted lipoprotein with Yx(FWY)xxD motif